MGTVTKLDADLSQYCLNHIVSAFDQLMDSYKSYQHAKEAKAWDAMHFWMDRVYYWSDSICQWIEQYEETKQ